MKFAKGIDIYKEYAAPLVRIPIALVFIWFSVNQLMIPSDWVGYMPKFLQQMPNPDTIILVNASVVLLLALMLLVGAYTRIVASLLGLHLMFIAFSLNWSSIAIRDFGLAFATLSIALHGSDRLCLKR